MTRHGPCRICGGELRAVFERSRHHHGRYRMEDVGSDLSAYACASCGAGELQNRDVDGWSAYPHGDEDREMLFAWELAPADVERLREALAGCPAPLRADCGCAVHEGLAPPQVRAARIDVADPPGRLPLVAVGRSDAGIAGFAPPDRADAT